MDLNGLKQKLAQCERQQQQLWAYRPLGQETLKSLREYYRVGLTYTSNALEGNSLTESETKVVIEDGLTIEGKPLRDVYEAVGHAKAYDYLYDLSHDAPITEETIRAVHKLFYRQIDPERAGEYRKVPICRCTCGGNQQTNAAISAMVRTSRRQDASRGTGC